MTPMLQGDDFAAVPELGYEEWRAVVRSIVGWYNAEGTDPNTFAGRVLVRSCSGSLQSVGITMLTGSSGHNGMCASMM